jgi:hypothetical protein
MKQQTFMQRAIDLALQKMRENSGGRAATEYRGRLESSYFGATRADEMIE